MKQNLYFKKLRQFYCEADVLKLKKGGRKWFYKVEMNLNL